jgi:hypothetical protein
LDLELAVAFGLVHGVVAVFFLASCSARFWHKDCESLAGVVVRRILDFVIGRRRRRSFQASEALQFCCVVPTHFVGKFCCFRRFRWSCSADIEFRRNFVSALGRIVGGDVMLRRFSS